MASNYPPGVTGRELAIAGPDWEDRIDEACECGFDGEVDGWGYGGITHWQCPQCGEEHESDDSGPDPDDQRDAMLDQMWDERWQDEQEARYGP